MEPILARPIPRCSVDGQPEMEEHDVFLVKKVDQLVKTQINPAFRKIRTRKGRRAEGPFVVAVHVSEEIYDAFRLWANVPYMKFAYDCNSRIVEYYGDPSEVHESFNAEFQESLMADIKAILANAPVQPVPSENDNSMAPRSSMASRSLGEQLGILTHCTRVRRRKEAVLSALLFQHSRSPSKKIEIPQQGISKKKEPDVLLSTVRPIRSDFQPKTLVVLETAVWNETVEQLANEVKMWKDSGSAVSVGYKIHRRKAPNGFDPMVYLFIAYDDSVKVDGIFTTVPRYLQYNIGRLSGVKALRQICSIGGVEDDSARRHLDAINYDGREEGAYEVMPGFELVDPAPPIVRIPLARVFLDALHLQGYDNESPALLDYFRESVLEIDVEVVRSTIIGLCLDEEATHRRNPAPDFGRFVANRLHSGEGYVEALHAWQIRDAQVGLDQPPATAEQQLPARRRLPNLLRRRQPAEVPQQHTMLTRSRTQQ